MVETGARAPDAACAYVLRSYIAHTCDYYVLLEWEAIVGYSYFEKGKS